MKKHLRLSLLAWLFVLFPLAGFSQTVTAVKGNKALVEVGSLELAPGDRIFSLDENGKRKSLLQVRQVRNGKAVAEVVKGVPQVGHTLAMGRKASAGASGGTGSSGYASRKSGQAYGFTAAIMMNTMKISNYTQNSQSYSFEMAGTNFGVGGFYDYPLTREWFVRGHGTFEMFDVKKSHATAICDNSTTTDCNAKFMQLGGYGTFNYIFSPMPFRTWAGAGGGILVYASKESTVLDTNKFFFNTVLMAAFGLDYFMNRSTFIPMAFEYQTIPDKEAGVTSMVIRAGWGKTF